MSRVIDYAWGRPSIEALRSAGAVAVCRYLSWLPNDKCLSRAEADRLRAAGIDVVSNWEYYGDWLHDYAGGRRTGALHALEADDQHIACGGPPDRPIYFSTDFAPTTGQLPVIADYYRGVADVIGLDRTGAYGGYDTIKHLFDVGVIRWGWQTYAWSNSRWDDRAQLRQVRNGVPVGGVDCDLNDTAADDFGQWGYDMAGEADKAFSAPYTDDSAFISPQSWMARAIELPLRELIEKLDGLSGDQPVAMTAEDRAAIVAELAAEIPTADAVAAALIRQLSA